MTASVCPITAEEFSESHSLKPSRFSFTFIGDSLLVFLGVEDEGWVSSDVDTFSFVGGGIEFSNNEVFVVLVEFSELFQNWSKFLAVSASWGIVLNKDIFGNVINNLIEFSSDDNSHWALSLWNWVGLEMWLERSRKD